MPECDRQAGRDDIAPTQTPADRRDAIYATLTDPKRRFTIEWMASEYAERDATWADVGFDRTALISEYEDEFEMNQSQAAATLHHSILPQLTDLGVLAYRRGAGTIHIASPDAMQELVGVATAVEEVCESFDA